MVIKQTLEYLKDRYIEEQARFDHFENKCSRFLTFVTVIIAALTAISGMKDGAIFHPKTNLSWLVLFLFLLGGFSILCSWAHALMAIRISDCSVMPKSRATAEYLLAVSEEQSLKHIYNCYVDTLEILSSQIEEKSKNLELAYGELTLSAWCLSSVAVLTVALEILK